MHEHHELERPRAPAGALRRWFAAVLTAALAACGSGGGGDSGGSPTPQPTADIPASRAEAARFLTQATFGPSQADIDRVMQLGLTGWIDEQFQQPATQHRTAWEAADAAAKAVDPMASAGNNDVLYAFYQGAVGGRDQLRQRVAYSLSQILVISMVDGNVGQYPRGTASYLDVLGDGAFGNYRNLLENVSKHPMMGLYLTSLRNRKEDPRSGRVPDENYAREVMQLFSIGLYELNNDGSIKTDADGKPLETYDAADIAGLAKVFTGWSWAGPDQSDARFNGNSSARDADREWKPMQGYAQFHSTSDKAFLTATIAAQTTADPDASLKVALDTLFAHPNVGPFIGKQLIQRLVTSNPSGAYVARVAAAFNDNGAGVRGDMKAVVKAVLLDPEARDAGKLGDTAFGKLREPVLRMTALLRAYGATSDSGRFLIGSSDDFGTSLGQTPMRSPTVFNFYRPGFVAPNTATGNANLAVPELQITHETSVAGYANFIRGVLQNGVGARAAGATRNDVQPDLSPAIVLADKPAELVADVDQRLAYGTLPAELKTAIEAAVNSVAIPGGSATQAQIDAAKRNRALIAIYLALVSPEFILQR
jgi:uncharacterized protein (DUF1800 family)